mmetsp:Transcript_4030/g.5889  ORF Transcript_4030/g.5889 Transcript_4030/m.5889 type:complete len:206 (-) Transcript_4030:668-1285(-)
MLFTQSFGIHLFLATLVRTPRPPAVGKTKPSPDTCFLACWLAAYFPAPVVVAESRAFFQLVASLHSTSLPPAMCNTKPTTCVRLHARWPPTALSSSMGTAISTTGVRFLTLFVLASLSAAVRFAKATPLISFITPNERTWIVTLLLAARLNPAVASRSRPLPSYDKSGVRLLPPCEVRNVWPRRTFVCRVRSRVIAPRCALVGHS